MKTNKIYHGNALELLDQIPDASIPLIISDGPYGVTSNEWDKFANLSTQEYNLMLIKIFNTKLIPGGVLYLFGKHDSIDFIDYSRYLTLQSRIIWYQPSSLAQGRKSYTDNHDMIAYFTKGKEARCFNLEDIRVPQVVDVKQQRRVEASPSVSRGPYNKTAYNPSGKNPGNVWVDIKPLTYKSKELVSRDTLNTIQKPQALFERLILASSKKGDIVLDPFCGVGTCPAICKLYGRKYIAFEINKDYITKAEQRLANIGGEQLSLFDIK